MRNSQEGFSQGRGATGLFVAGKPHPQQGHKEGPAEKFQVVGMDMEWKRASFKSCRNPEFTRTPPSLC